MARPAGRLAAGDRTKPLILVAEDDPGARERIAVELNRRFGPDYEIVVLASGHLAVQTLEETHRRNREVAVALSGVALPDLPGTEVLAQVHRWHPTARRGLLIDWGDWAKPEIAQAVLRAMGLGVIDYYVLRPWRSPDELFIRTVAEFVHEWSRTHAEGGGPITLIGDRWSARASEVRSILTRNGVPHVFRYADEPAAESQLAALGADCKRPVLVGLDGVALQRPSDLQVAEACGLPTTLQTSEVDLLIVGAGPAGLAAAVYAGSEGLSTLVIERETIGGQAGSSSLIRNYLGFARGVSGAELTMRAYQQAWVFGVRFLMMHEVVELRAEAARLVAVLSDDQEVRARAVVIATGVSYRRLEAPGLPEREGAGVFYGASIAEAQALRGEPVVVVGGGNSAGQAAMHLAKYASTVTMLIRGETLASSMSRYLIDEINAASNIDVLYGAEIAAAEGTGRLEQLTIRDRASQRTRDLPVTGLFVLVGARPHTDWLPAAVARDPWGYVITGSGLLDAELAPAWPLERSPEPFETRLPGVFAVGDVRQRAVKRVASAVGEGSVVVSQVHTHLARETEADE